MSDARDLFEDFDESLRGLSPRDQVKATENFTAVLLRHLDTAQIKEVHRQCVARSAHGEPCACCGEKPGARLIALIEGHIALREMGLIEPQPSS